MGDVIQLWGKTENRGRPVRPVLRRAKFSKHFADIQKLSAKAKAASREFDEVRKGLESEIESLSLPFRFEPRVFPEGYSEWTTRAIIAIYLLEKLDEMEETCEVPNQYNLLLHAQQHLRKHVLTDDYFSKGLEEIRYAYHSFCEGFVWAAAKACNMELQPLTEEIKANKIKLELAVDEVNGIR